MKIDPESKIGPDGKRYPKDEVPDIPLEERLAERGRKIASGLGLPIGDDEPSDEPKKAKARKS